MSFSRLAASFFWLGFAILPAKAWAYALSCTNAYNYTYYTEDAAVASKCKYNYDDECVWKNTSGNCKWQGSFKGAAKTQSQNPPKNNGSDKDETKESNLGKRPIAKPVVEPIEKAPTNKPNPPIANMGGAKPEVDSYQPLTNAPQANIDPSLTQDNKVPNSYDAEPEENTAQKLAEAMKKKKELEAARNEAKISAGKVEELKLTMEEIKINNQNNAILYRSPNANIGSVDPRFNALGAGVSGEVGGPNAGNGFAGGLLGNGAFQGNSSLKGKNKDKPGRDLASSREIEASLALPSEAGATKSERSSATSDNPWVTYMGQTSKAGLIDRLRKNPKLRDSLRDRIGELQARGDQSGVVELMEEALASAEKESQSPDLDNLKPMAFMEAFSMDSAETEAQIRNLIADLDTHSDPQFLPQTSLFERVSVAHRRSLLRGTVRAKQ